MLIFYIYTKTFSELIARNLSFYTLPPKFFQVRTLEQRKEIEELSAQVAELEQLRKKQARKIHELKSEVDTTQNSSEENRVVAGNAVQALSSELRTTKAALMAIQNREKAVCIVLFTGIMIFNSMFTAKQFVFVLYT